MRTRTIVLSASYITNYVNRGQRKLVFETRPLPPTVWLNTRRLCVHSVLKSSKLRPRRDNSARSPFGWSATRLQWQQQGSIFWNKDEKLYCLGNNYIRLFLIPEINEFHQRYCHWWQIIITRITKARERRTLMARSLSNITGIVIRLGVPRPIWHQVLISQKQ